METKWLLDFLSLVDTGNFSRSADMRATTQPAFSRRIRALEDWVGATLFNRSTQPIELTQAGAHFRPVAEEVLRRLLQSREEIQQIGRSTESTITFAATHSLSLVFFPRWISSIEDKAGVLRTRLDSNQIANCVQTLLHGECHFLLLPTHATVDIQLPEERFSSLVVGHDRLIPVSAPDEAGGRATACRARGRRRCITWPMRRPRPVAVRSSSCCRTILGRRCCTVCSTPIWRRY